MVLQIKKYKSGYIAIATPPNSKTGWSTLEPIELRELELTLHELGCHQVDVGDALAAADPEIRREFEEASHRLRVKDVGPERAAEIEKQVAEEFREQEEINRKYGDDAEAWVNAHAERKRIREGPERADQYLRDYAELQRRLAFAEASGISEQLRVKRTADARKTKEFIEGLKKRVGNSGDAEMQAALAALLEEIYRRPSKS